LSIQNVDEQLEKFRGEILEYLTECYEFHTVEDIVEILRKISAYRARASWIRFGIIKGTNPKFNRFRIDELDPFIAELDNQFKIYSRVSSVQQFEWEMSKG